MSLETVACVAVARWARERWLREQTREAYEAWVTAAACVVDHAEVDLSIARREEVQP